MGGNFKGKTKIVCPYSESRLRLQFRDTVLGHSDGQPDSGGNRVVDHEKGKDMISMFLCRYFFELLNGKGINTHYIKTVPEKKSIIVRKADIFGDGLEFICRLEAYGSFIKRYGDYTERFKKLNYLTEITIKDDDRRDPQINDDTLIELDIISANHLKKAKKITRRVAKIIDADLRKKDLKLIDIKIEFGLKDGKLVVIDTINCDNMRIRKTGSQKLIGYKELADILIPEK